MALRHCRSAKNEKYETSKVCYTVNFGQTIQDFNTDRNDLNI